VHCPLNHTRAAEEKGGETELRFFEAIQCPEWKPPFWYSGVRHASRTEDREGVDAVVNIDVGEIPVQIKSSHASRMKHIEQYGRSHVIIVISEHMTPRMIRSKLMNLLYYRRGEFFQKKKIDANRARR
jgi:hypothetical protein